MFGDKTKAFNSKLGIKGGLGNAAGAVTDKKSGLRSTFQKGGKVARNAAVAGVSGLGKAIGKSELGQAIGNSKVMKKIKNSKVGEAFSATGRGVARAVNAVRNFSNDAPKAIKNFGSAIRSFAAGDRGKGFKELGKKKKK